MSDFMILGINFMILGIIFSYALWIYVLVLFAKFVGAHARIAKAIEKMVVHQRHSHAADSDKLAGKAE